MTEMANFAGASPDFVSGVITSREFLEEGIGNEK
jgi:hypothetical protein